MAATKTKTAANYRKGAGARRCENCTMYRNGRCTLVMGPIDPDDVCDFFERK